MDPLGKILALLQERLGLDISSIGQASIDRALQKRMRVLSLARLDAYLAQLRSSSQEVSELIDEVVVPETWFFRDITPFEVINRHALLKLRTNRSRPLRLLSAPCSTGEEAYSMAIALLEAGVMSCQFRILAIDISKRSIVKALKGEYRRNSFREKDIQLLEKYFRTLGENCFLLSRSIRDKVHFQEGNLLDPNFMESLGTFDILFCRNVLIYFDSKAREQVLLNLERGLAEDGLLFVGHSESGLLAPDRFRPAPYHKAFAFRKVHHAMAEPADEEAAAADAISMVPAPSAAKCRATHNSILATNYRYSTTTQVGLPNMQKTPAEELAAARRLADEGSHEEAIETCRNSINKHGPSAEAYFLLGLIHDEMGNSEEAMKMLRKAIYLEPNHEDALVLIALLAERAGDPDRARVFAERARRVHHD